MDDISIALLQTDIVWQDRASNLGHLDGLIDSMKDSPDLILLPETFNTGFPVDPTVYAETRQGATMQWLRETAARKQTVIAGSLLLDEPDGYYNTFVWMHPDGLCQTYRKRHTFGIGGEGEPIKKGEDKLIVEVKGWRIMPLVCYDLRFPVWSRNSLTDSGFAYDVLVFTANFPASRMMVWDTLLKARALENQSYIVAVNRVGTTPDGTYYSGHSQVIDAKGNVVAKARDGEEETLQHILNACQLSDFRAAFPVARDWD